MNSLLERPSEPPSSVGYSVITLPEYARDLDELRRGAERWLGSDAMTRLLAAFGKELRESTFRGRLVELEAVAAELFDARRGRERWEADYRDHPREVVDATRAVVAAVYRDPAGPPRGDLGAPTHVLVPGGRLRSCLLRAELVRDLLSAGLPPAPIWGLASRRPATDSEVRLGQEFARGSVQDELDAMSVALGWALDIPQVRAQERPLEERLPAEVRELRGGPASVIGLAAPAEPDAGRVTTAGTYRFFAASTDLSSLDHLLIVTSAIHAPFQHALALGHLALPTGARVTSVGAHITTSALADVRETWSTGEWLQEILSAIRSLRRMDDEVIAFGRDQAGA
ncbi:hypothetical protein [Actinomycetospora corticicola]|uniref:Uncharacterized protein n=1 Tax=Actinomycetospora corticicola TaxID=663602 RepID=A0A7Y9J748_9PSEU|nr:hypothetical protein [Actinomycetospora corticicola]NYD37913.1 hypothetical protein [Actinomycetospora corticicola]